MSQAGIINAGGGSGGGTVKTLTGDTGGAVPPSAGGNINILGKPDLLIAGNIGTNTLQGTNLTKITPYVVGPLNQYAYQTIQSALNAANAAGGGLVFVTFGTYTENLTFFPNIQIFGDSEQGTTIIGTHTPPASGTFNINRIAFQSATNIFSSAAAGTTAIIMEDCQVIVTNGYTFNIPNFTSTASVAVFNIGNFGTNDGFLNNTGGCQFYVFAAGVGNGTVNPLTVSGICVLAQAVVVGCSVNFVSGANLTSVGSQYTQTVTFSNNSVGSFYGDSFVTGASTALTQSSTGAISLNNVTINSSANPVVSGAGAGSVNLNSVDFASGKNIAGTITRAYPGSLETGIAYLQNVSFDRGTTTIATDGQLIIGRTGSNPQIGKIVSPLGTIVVSYLNPNITLEAATNFAFNYVQINHASSPYIATATDYYIACDPTAGTITVKLPDAPSTKRLFVIKDRTGKAATNSISITTIGGAVTIDGVTTYTLSSNFESVQLLFNGTSYEVF